jgi:hypothetical protein
MSNSVAKVEVLTQEEYEALAEKEMDGTFQALAQRPRPYQIPRSVGRKNVERAFHTAFEMIGGVPRLSLWADLHPTEFYKLYSRMLPQEMNANVDATIKMVLPRTALDE